MRVLHAIARGDDLLGPILLDDLNIYRVLCYIRKYIKARLQEAPDLRKRAEKLANDVDQARSDRNLFIHGLWLTDADLLASGRVSCLQYRFQYDKKTDEWEYLHDHKFTLKQLAVKRVTIFILCDQAMQLGKDIEAYLGPRK